MKTGPCERCGSSDWHEGWRLYRDKNGNQRRYRHRKCLECARRRRRAWLVRRAHDNPAA